MRRRLSVNTLAVATFFLLISGASADELKWQWTPGDKFIYVVSAKLDVKKPVPLEGELEGAIHVDVMEPEVAAFRFLLTRNAARDNTGTYESPPEVLRNASVIGRFDPFSRVTGIKDSKLRDNIGQYMAAWFPPLRPGAKTGESWKIDFPAGVGLAGTVRYEAVHYGEEENRIAVIKFSFTGGSGTKLTRTITGTAHFDLERGRYINVNRTIRIRGTREIETGRPSKGLKKGKEKQSVQVEEFRAAECSLVSSPENVHPSVAERERIDTLIKRVEADPKDASARLDLGCIYSAKKDFEKAKTYFIQALAIQDNYEARIYLARIYLNEGDLATAEEHFSAAYEKFPGTSNASARLGLGHVHFRRGDYENALAVADKVLKKNPDSAGAHYLKGLSLGKTEAMKKQPDFSKATAEIRKYIELDRNLSSKERRIKFAKDGTLRVLVESAGNYRFTEEELAYGRQLVKRVLSEAAERLNISDVELVAVLDFLAGLIEKTPGEMIDEFIKDRKKTGAEIEKAFAEVTEPDAAKIASAVRGGWELFPYLAATTFQPPDQAREMLLTYSEKAPKSRGEIYLFLSATYLDDVKTSRQKLDENLKLARHLCGDNPLPWLISAHLALLDMHITGKGSMMSFLDKVPALGRFRDYRTELLNARLALLEETKFPAKVPEGSKEGWSKALRLTTAASWRPDRISSALRTFLRNLLALSRSFRDGRNSLVEEQNLDREQRAKYCITIAKHGLIVAYILREGTDLIELSLDAASTEEEFRKTLVKAYEDLGSIYRAAGDTDKIDKNAEIVRKLREQYSVLHLKQRPYFHAVERYSKERDRALGIMSISDPVQAAGRAAEILKGERTAFEKAVEDWLAARKSEPLDKEQAEPLGPAIDNPFAPAAPGKKTR